MHVRYFLFRIKPPKLNYEQNADSNCSSNVKGLSTENHFHTLSLLPHINMSPRLDRAREWLSPADIFISVWKWSLSTFVGTAMSSSEPQAGP